MPYKPRKTHLDDAEENISLDNAPLQPTRFQATNPLVIKVQSWMTAPLHVGDTWYALPMRWYVAFCASPEEVSKINTHALANPGTSHLRLHAKKGVDYELVPQVAWDTLVQLCGLDGCPIRCPVVEGKNKGMVPFIDTHPHIQKPKRTHIVDYRPGVGNQPLTVELILMGTPGDEEVELPKVTLSAYAKVPELARLSCELLELEVREDDLMFAPVSCVVRERAIAQGGVVLPSRCYDVSYTNISCHHVTLDRLRFTPPIVTLIVEQHINGVWQSDPRKSSV